MLRQNTGNVFVQVSLALVLSLCSLSVFSDDVRYITFLRKTGSDTDNYTVTEQWRQRDCIEKVSPESTSIPKDGGQTINITYLKTVEGCAVLDSKALFKVQSKERPDIFAFVKWVKYPGKAPQMLNVDGLDRMDILGLTKIDNSDPNNIKVWVGCDGESQ